MFSFDSHFAFTLADEDQVIKEDSFVELADLCSRMCHVLEAVGDLGGFSDQIEELGRHVSPACGFLSTILIGLRIVSKIESAIRKRANCLIDLREILHVTTEECFNTWRKDLCGILSCFDVRRCQLSPCTTTPQPSILERLKAGHFA